MLLTLLEIHVEFSTVLYARWLTLIDELSFWATAATIVVVSWSCWTDRLSLRLLPTATVECFHHLASNLYRNIDNDRGSRRIAPRGVFFLWFLYNSTNDCLQETTWDNDEDEWPSLHIIITNTRTNGAPRRDASRVPGMFFFVYRVFMDRLYYTYECERQQELKLKARTHLEPSFFIFLFFFKLFHWQLLFTDTSPLPLPS